LVSAGEVYATQEHKVGSLSAALRAFKAALDLQPDSFEAAHAYIRVLLNKGKLVEEVSYFSDVRAECEKIEPVALLQTESSQVHFFWDWGKSFFHIGQCYGEAIDFHKACEKYQQAASRGLSSPEFYKDYGDVYLQLSRLLGKEQYCLEATEW